ncbi:ribosome maturation factor RimM [Methylotenera sp. 1P/1]|jgi:16S rRNA processing protein RimM|uniref:ribosome maturation factor RimM n=1 Tax=Methylotenera sp. 1P/1 TaxID=1131551 RepID=UPI0003729101|nr:ribosome maturation factor RimM [Methylotenera sp. 1P/1]
MVVMGRIVAPYGVYGWLKVLPDTEVLDGLFDYDAWWIGKQDNWREVVVEQAKIHNDVLVVKLAGVDDRDQAFACKGLQVAVPRDALPVPDDNEYYWSDLIGLAVKNQQDIDFGYVTDVFETGANDVLVVKTGKENGNIERLIPFIDQVVIAVDVVAKTMLVDWDADF